MNQDEVLDLLSVVTAYDNRTPTQAVVAAWTEVAQRGRWTYVEAVDAVHTHFAESTDYLMPAMITTRIRAGRQDRALREEQRQLEAHPSDPATAERIQQIVGELAQRMAWAKEGQQRSGFALKVGCPHCGANVGARCVNPATQKALQETPAHQSRVDTLTDYLRSSL